MGARMSHWLFLSIAIAAEVIGTSFLKSSEGFTRLGPSMVVIAGYVTAFYFLSLTLKTMPVGIAYAVWCGAGIVLIALIGWTFLGQRLDAAALAGIGLILAGVVVIYTFSSSLSRGGPG
jgi:small multidrug resistance pump